MESAEKPAVPVVTAPVEKGPEFPPWLLNTGFISALVLAAVCLVAGGYYLHEFQQATQTSVLKVINGKAIPEPGVFQLAIMAQMYLTRIQLLSCCIFVGMAFGFLGFALFLLGVKGEIDAQGSGATLTVKVLSLSPGVFVLLCATILIGICATRPLRFDYDQKGKSSPPASRNSSPVDSTAGIPKPIVIPPDSTE